MYSASPAISHRRGRGQQNQRGEAANDNNGQNQGGGGREEFNEEDLQLLEEGPWSIVKDFFIILRASWLPALLVGLLLGVVAALVLVRDHEEYRKHALMNENNHHMTWYDEHYSHARRLTGEGNARYVPTYDEQERLSNDWLGSETLIILSNGEQVKLSASARAHEVHGHRELPGFFYDAVHYGITAANPGLLMLTTTQEEIKQANARLEKDLQKLNPRPTRIFKSLSYNEKSGWSEPGLAVQFRFDDLRRQGFQGEARSHQTRNEILWQAATDAMLKVARKYGQLAVFQWHPYEWGTLKEEDKAQQQQHHKGTGYRRHKNVLQVVIPTRTGMNKLRSSAVVWRRN